MTAAERSQATAPPGQAALERQIDEAAALYQRKGFGGRVGFGSEPALLVIDLVNGWTEPDRPLGANLSEVIEHTNELLAVFRRQRRPVFFTTMAYEPHFRDAGLIIRKSPALHDAVLGTAATEVNPALGRRPDETLIVKKYPSAFFGTPLASTLTALGVDTTIVTGCSTSACVRATALDALCHGFRPILPAECIGDRAAGPHVWNLFDIDAKFGDVEPLTTVLDYLDPLPSKQAP